MPRLHALTVGALLAQKEILHLLFEPTLNLLMSVPTIAWIPIFLITLGLGDRTVITAIFVSSFFAIVYNTMRGIEMIDKNVVNAARMMGLGGIKLFVHVLLPASMLSIINGLRLAIGYAWRALVGGELLAAMIERFGGEQIRFFLLRTHYRSTVVFSDEALTESSAALETFYRFFERYQRVTGQSFYDLPIPRTRTAGELAPGTDPLLLEVQRYRTGFLEKMDDDFNSGAAIGDLFELVRLLNKHVDKHQLEDAAQPDPTHVAALGTGARALRELAALLGLFLHPRPAAPATADAERPLVARLMELLIELRAAARQRKDFATADRIRDALGDLGITLEDRKGGTIWRQL